MRCSSCPLTGRKTYRSDRGEGGLMTFVGSSPRSYEIKDGKAFSGEGPKVLRSILSGLDVPLERCYFTHSMGCQTPKGRKAKVEEIRACSGDLYERLSDHPAKIIVAMGDDALRAFRQTTRAAGTMRGQVAHFHETPVMLTIDPHKVVRVNPRYAAADEVHDASGSPEAFLDLYRDVERAVAYALADTPLVASIPYEDYYLADTMFKFRKLLKRLNRLPEGTYIAADVETSSLDYHTGRILTLGLSWKEGTGVGIRWDLIDDDNAAVVALSDALDRHHLIFHDGVFDVPWMRKAGLNTRWSGDTALLHYLTDERIGTHRLERLAIDRLSWPAYETALKEKFKVGTEADEDAGASYENVEMTALLRYNVADCDATLRIWNSLRREDEVEAFRLHDDLLLPAAEHFLRLERDGMLVDQEYHEALGARWRAEMDELEETLQVGINLNSPKQIATYLFDTLGLEPMPGEDDGYVNPDKVLELTDAVEDPEAQEYFRVAASTAFMKLKPRATSTYMLWWLADQHPWPRALVQYRVIGTRYRTYYEGIKSRLIDGRIRPRFKLHGTRTGRLSSTNPNIHGIARDLDVKNIFIADPGYALIAADYSQAEVRMMAHFARDEQLVQALAEADIHRAISRRLFGLTEEDLDAMPDERVKFLRRAAKTIIFGLIYGRSAKSLAPQLGVSLEETERYISDLFRMMPEVPKFIRVQQARVMREQEAVSLFGRKRRFPLILRASASQVKRQGVNMPIQSSVSDMTLMANLEVLRQMDRKDMLPRVWPHVHDGFTVQVPKGEVERGVEIIKDVMLNPPFDTEVHFACEIEVGRRWGDMEKVFNG